MIDFVCFSTNNWEKRRARKQQFMLCLSFRDDVGRVLYVEPPLNLWRLILMPCIELRSQENRARWKRALLFRAVPCDESKKLFIFTQLFIFPFSFRWHRLYKINLYISAAIIRSKSKQKGFRNIVLWVYHPFDYLLLRWFKEKILSVFDWTDEWSEYYIEYGSSKKRYIRFLEEKIISKSDIVFAVAETFFRQAYLLNPHTYHIAHGVSYEIFQEFDGVIPADISQIKRPIAGYLGTISERLDVELLEFVAQQLPNVSFVLVGDVHFQRVSFNTLHRLKNVYFLGEKKYSDLGRYSYFFDVCILPYRAQACALLSPTKIYDYLAIGKPIVSTDLAPVNPYKDVVYIARSREEFVQLLNKAFDEHNPELCQIRKKIAQQNAWPGRVQQIVDIINSRLKK